MKRPSRPRLYKVSDGFKSFVLDQLQTLGHVAPRAMFGGVGLYCDGLFFAILAGDVVYLKADDVNRPVYERAGASSFWPQAHRGGPMKYYSVPAGVLEDRPELLDWARMAVAAARRAASDTPKRRAAPLRKATRPRLKR